MITLILTVGLPGSGKSTFLKNRIAKEGGIRVSRDDIRFSILKDGEDYFAHETEVFNTFIKTIQTAIDTGAEEKIYVDATHLSKAGRTQLLDNLDLYNVDKIEILYFDIPLLTCLRRNEQRRGIGRTYVPKGVIRRMSAQMEAPKLKENYTYNKIWIVNEGGEING